MSTRQLLNMTMGAFAMLLLAAIGIVFSTTGSQDDQNTRIDLAVRQQVLIQDLTNETSTLVDSEDRETVAAAREDLAHTIVQFDRNLTALLHGGQAVDANGQTVVVNRTRNDMARLALEDGAHLWVETGMPLADLAAGEFSVFSAAGQKAVKGLQTNNVELMQHMGTAANALRMGLHARATIARFAQWTAAGLATILIGLGFFRRKLVDPVVPVRTAATVSPQPTEPTRQTPVGLPGAVSEMNSFTSPVDFNTVNASVDQMSVDMNTIAGSTDKMRLAIDSVGHALQGMLYSLNEMAQDTAEGHKIVRNANNAASFTATAAGDLAASAREMADVVSRVTQLAQKTKQVAAQIDAEAVHTGKTGEAFTSVVAGEVKGLARQTSHATREIEDTVAGILATARQYEEAIGQIIKNISAINKVSENLGELMLSPPVHVQPGTPLPAAPALTPPPAAAAPVAPAATEPTPAPVEPVAATPPPEPTPAAAPPIVDDPIEVEATPEEVAAETATAIEETVEASEPDGGSNGNVFMLGGRAKKPNALNIPKVPVEEEAPVEPEAAAEPAPETETPATVPEPEAAPEAEAKPDGGSNGNVFMLGGPKKKAPAAKPAAPAEPEAEAAPEPAPAAEVPAEPEATAPAPEPETAAPAAFDGPNVYGLDLPAAAPAAKPETDAVPETVPPAEEEAKDDAASNANIFMLNKPK